MNGAAFISWQKVDHTMGFQPTPAYSRDIIWYCRINLRFNKYPIIILINNNGNKLYRCPQESAV